jgi:hypothetical protein
MQRVRAWGRVTYGLRWSMTTEAENATIALMERFRSYVGMLFFAPNDQLTPQTVRFNGTAAFVNTGRARIVVTNAHVYRRFRELEQEEPSLKMFLTGSAKNQVLELKNKYLIADGEHAVDLAVFSFPNVDQVEAIGKRYFMAHPWPASRPEVGTTAVIIGFQGAHRHAGETTLTVNLTVICDRVTSCSPRHLILVDEDVARVSVKVNPSLGELGALGGMSGSPVFTMDRENYANIVGFLYETGEGTAAMVFAVHADFLTPEGKIDHAQIGF